MRVTTTHTRCELRDTPRVLAILGIIFGGIVGFTSFLFLLLNLWDITLTSFIICQLAGWGGMILCIVVLCVLEKCNTGGSGRRTAAFHTTLQSTPSRQSDNVYTAEGRMNAAPTYTNTTTTTHTHVNVQPTPVIVNVLSSAEKTRQYFNAFSEVDVVGQYGEQPLFFSLVDEAVSQGNVLTIEEVFSNVSTIEEVLFVVFEGAGELGVFSLILGTSGTVYAIKFSDLRADPDFKNKAQQMGLILRKEDVYEASNGLYRCQFFSKAKQGL